MIKDWSGGVFILVVCPHIKCSSQPAAGLKEITMIKI
jgi:hypothetical protein